MHLLTGARLPVAPINRRAPSVRAVCCHALQPVRAATFPVRAESSARLGGVCHQLQPARCVLQLAHQILHLRHCAYLQPCGREKRLANESFWSVFRASGKSAVIAHPPYSRQPNNVGTKSHHGEGGGEAAQAGGLQVCMGNQRQERGKLRGQPKAGGRQSRARAPSLPTRAKRKRIKADRRVAVARPPHRCPRWQTLT